MTPLLISVQDFAFLGAEGEPPHSFRSCLGLTYSAFPAGVFVLHSNQQLEPVKYTVYTFTKRIKTERFRFLGKNFE